MLDLIPAIDIKDGACVRLVQGDLDKNITVYSKDPRDMARHCRARCAPSPRGGS